MSETFEANQPMNSGSETASSTAALYFQQVQRTG